MSKTALAKIAVDSDSILQTCLTRSIFVNRPALENNVVKSQTFNYHIIIEWKKISEKLDWRGESVDSRCRCVGERNRCKCSITEPTSYTPIYQASIRFRENNVVRDQRSIISLSFIGIGSGSMDLNKRSPLKHAICTAACTNRVHALCIKMLHIRVLSNNEWKAIPPTRGAIENTAGSEISIIASGYYIHRVPLFSMSCSFRHRHFRDIAISYRRCIRERENDLSITASSRSTSRAPVICISPGVQNAICNAIKDNVYSCRKSYYKIWKENFLWIVIYIFLLNILTICHFAALELHFI